MAHLAERFHGRGWRLRGRGLHSSTFQLNLSRFWHTIHPRHSLIPPDTHSTPPKQLLSAHPIPHEALTLSREVEECKPLLRGSTQTVRRNDLGDNRFLGRGSHSFRFQLNLSNFRTHSWIK